MCFRKLSEAEQLAMELRAELQDRDQQLAEMRTRLELGGRSLLFVFLDMKMKSIKMNNWEIKNYQENLN